MQWGSGRLSRGRSLDLAGNCVPGLMELQPPPTTPTKFCPGCRQIKPLDNFPKNRSSKDGLAAYCKPCHNRIMKEQKDRRYGGERSYLLKLRYGISAAEVQSLIEKQG